jgi:Domain of unknown function (DUF4411)
VYVIDTSALLDGWARHYPPDVFPSLWSLIEEMIKVGELLSPDEVLGELSQKDDAVYQWAKTNSTMFVPLDEDVSAGDAGNSRPVSTPRGRHEGAKPRGPLRYRPRQSKGRDRCNWRKERRDSGPPENSYRSATTLVLVIVHCCSLSETKDGPLSSHSIQ